MESALVREFVAQRDRLFGFILALTRDYVAAEDVFQEVAVAVLSEDRRGTAPENFTAWTREVARRRVAEHFRAQSRARALNPVPPHLEEAICRSFEEDVGTPEQDQRRLRHLAACLERLSARAREIIRRRYGEGLPIAAVAAAVSWQEGSVKVALCRARKFLAACVAARLKAEEQA